MHLAGAVGTPVVAIFGPSDPARYALRGRHDRVVRVDLPCSPCNRIRLPAGALRRPHARLPRAASRRRASFDAARRGARRRRARLRRARAGARMTRRDPHAAAPARATRRVDLADYLDAATRKSAPRPARTPGSRACGTRASTACRCAGASRYRGRLAVVVRRALPPQAAGRARASSARSPRSTRCSTREQPSAIARRRGRAAGRGSSPRGSPPRAACGSTARRRRPAGARARWPRWMRAARWLQAAALASRLRRRRRAGAPRRGDGPGVRPSRVLAGGGGRRQRRAVHRAGAAGARGSACRRRAAATSASGRRRTSARGAGGTRWSATRGRQRAVRSRRSRRSTALRPSRAAVARAARAAPRAVAAATICARVAQIDGCDCWPIIRDELAGIALLQWPWSARAMDEAGAALDALGAVGRADLRRGGRLGPRDRARVPAPRHSDGRPAARLHLPPLAELPARAGRDGRRSRASGRRRLPASVA